MIRHPGIQVRMLVDLDLPSPPLQGTQSSPAFLWGFFSKKSCPEGKVFLSRAFSAAGSFSVLKCPCLVNMLSNSSHYS